MYFTESHEWIDLKGSVGTVGISNYAQQELGEIVSIELPQVGQSVKAGQEICVLESTKAAVDVYAPVSGKIVAVNEALKAKPSQINQTAESTAWLFRMEVSNIQDVKSLMSRAQYLEKI